MKSLAERKEKELDKQSQELQELKTNNDGLRKMLRKKEKESEEKDREIARKNRRNPVKVTACVSIWYLNN